MSDTNKELQEQLDKHIEFMQEENSASFDHKLAQCIMLRLMVKEIWDDNLNAYQGKILKEINNDQHLAVKMSTHHALNHARQKLATEMTLSADISLKLPIQPTTKTINDPNKPDALSVDKKTFSTFVNAAFNRILNCTNFNLLKETKIIYGSAFALINFSDFLKKNNANLTKALPLPDVTVINPENFWIDGVDTFDKANWMFYANRISFWNMKSYVFNLIKSFDMSDAAKVRWEKRIDEIMANYQGAMRSVSNNYAMFSQHFVQYFIFSANLQITSPVVDMVVEYEYDIKHNVYLKVYAGKFFIGKLKTGWKQIPIVPLYDIEEIGRIYGRSQLQVDIIDQEAIDRFMSLSLTRQTIENKPILTINANSGVNTDDFVARYRNGETANVLVVKNNPQEAISKLPPNPTNSQTADMWLSMTERNMQNSSGMTPAYGGNLGSATTGAAANARVAMATKVDQIFINQYRNFIHRLWPILLDQWRSIAKDTYTLWYENLNPDMPQDDVYIDFKKETLDYEWMINIDDIQFGSKDQVAWQTIVQMAQMNNLFPGSQLVTPKQFVKLSPLPIAIKNAFLEQLEMTDQQVLLHKAADVIKVIMAAMHMSGVAADQGNAQAMVRQLPQMVAQMIAPWTPPQMDDQIVQQQAQQQAAAQQQARSQPQGVGGNDTLNQNGSQFNPQQQGGQ